MVQWIRICLPMQETQVRSLVQKDPTCIGEARPGHHSRWACILEPRSRNYSAHVSQRERSPQWASMISSTNIDFFFFLVRVFPMHVDIIVNNLSLYKFPNWFGTIQNTNHIGSCNLKFDQLITRYTHTCPHSEKPHASQLENSPR